MISAHEHRPLSRIGRSWASMPGAESAFLAYSFLEGEDDGDASEADEGHVAEVIDVRPQAGLPIHCEADEGISALHGVSSGGSLRGEIGLHASERSLHVGPRRIYGDHQFIAMHLLVARDDRVYDGNTDAASDVAQKVVESAGVADLFVLQKRH